MAKLNNQRDAIILDNPLIPSVKLKALIKINTHKIVIIVLWFIINCLFIENDSIKIFDIKKFLFNNRNINNIKILIKNLFLYERVNMSSINPKIKKELKLI